MDLSGVGVVNGEDGGNGDDDNDYKNSHILPTGQWYAPSAVNYSAYSAYSSYPA